MLKSRKSYLCRFSPDGQVLAIAMNQKIATDNKLMFFGPGDIPVAVVTDLMGCGARVRSNKQSSGRLIDVIYLHLGNLHSKELILIFAKRIFNPCTPFNG